MLCLFSGEEQGLLGSKAYANHLADLNSEVVAMSVPAPPSCLHRVFWWTEFHAAFTPLFVILLILAVCLPCRFNSDMLGYKLPTTEVTISYKDRSVADWLVEASKA